MINNKTLFALAVIMTLSCVSHAQHALRDAIELRKLILATNPRPTPPVLLKPIDSTLAVLRNYVPGNIKDDPEEIANFIARNPFIRLAGTPQADDPRMSGFARLTRSAIAGLGGMDVTKLADGLAKFLVERTKEELAVAFFVQLKKDFNDPRYQDLALLFSQTTRLLNLIDEKIYQFTIYLTDLRNAFILDLKGLTLTMPVVLQQPKYQQYFATRPQLRHALQISLFAANALIVKSKVNHIGNVIDTLQPDLFFPAAIDDNKDFNGAVKTLQFISNSFRSTDTTGAHNNTTRYWISGDSAQMLAKDSTIFQIYLGLLYAQLTTRDIQFRNTTLKNVLDTVATKREFLHVQSSLSEFLLHLDLFENHKKTFVVTPGSSKDSLHLYLHGTYNAGINVLDKGLALARTWVRGLLPNADNLRKMLTETGNVYLYVSQERYAVAVLSLTKLYSAAFPDSMSNKKFTKFVSKLGLYATFFSEVANAENSDEVKNIIARTVLPTGSSYIKKQSRWNIALNAYTGLYAGQERLRTDTTFSGVGGVYAPLGIAISKGFGSKRSPWSGTLFVSMIDIGSLVAFRFSNYNDTIANDIRIRLSQIVSPGVHGIIGLPNIPVSIGAGISWSPLISKVEKDQLTLLPAGHRPFRWQIFAAVDIPFLNFFNKPRQ